MGWSPYWRRRTARNAAIAATFLICGMLFWRLFAERRDFISHLSIALAYPALFLLAAALLLGPWNVLRGRPNPLSFDLRRDIGIWAGVMAAGHTVVGLNVHLRGRPWLYFVNEHHHVRHDLFGFGNHTGLIAAVLFVILLIISNDAWLRRLGSRKWKSVQRWTYIVAGLTFVHAAAYQSIEKRGLSFAIVLWVTIAVVISMQLGALLKRVRATGFG